MNIEEFSALLTDIVETKKELDPIETAVIRGKEELKELEDRHAFLQAESSKAARILDEAEAKLKDAEDTNRAADEHYEFQVRRGQQVVERASSKAARILRENGDQKRLIEEETTRLNQEKHQLRGEIQALVDEKYEKEAEMADLKDNVRALREARAELIIQSRADVPLD